MPFVLRNAFYGMPFFAKCKALEKSEARFVTDKQRGNFRKAAIPFPWLQLFR